MSVSRIKPAKAFNEQWKSSKISHNLVLQNHSNTHAEAKPKNPIDWLQILKKKKKNLNVR